MHFILQQFVRTPEQRAAYDKDTKEKDMLTALTQVCQNFEQYSIPAAILIYIFAFIAFLYYKITFTLVDDNTTSIDDLVTNIKGHLH